MDTKDLESTSSNDCVGIRRPGWIRTFSRLRLQKLVNSGVCHAICETRAGGFVPQEATCQKDYSVLQRLCTGSVYSARFMIPSATEVFVVLVRLKEGSAQPDPLLEEADGDIASICICMYVCIYIYIYICTELKAALA